MIKSLGGFGGKDICAVDIGYHSVKVLQVSLARKKGQVRRLLTQKTGLTPSVPQDETPGYIVDALTSAWKEAGIKGKKVISAIPGRAVFVRQLRIPFVTGERLDRIVRYEAKQQIPFPVDQMKIDYHVFPSEGGELEVTLVAVKRDIIEEHVGILRSAGLLPELIDVTSLALYNLQMDKPREEEGLVTAFVNIGASTTDIVIENGGVLKFMRSAPVAGNALTMALERDLGVSFEEAEDLKVTQGSVAGGGGGAPAEGQADMGAAVRDILESALERGIITEIRKSIDFFISQPEGLTVNQIIVTGGTSRLPGIESFMEDRLGMPVAKASLDGIQSLDLSSLDGFVDRDVSSVVLGLAEREVNEARIALNFTPQWIEERKRFRARRGALVVQFILILAILGATVYRANVELMGMRATWEYVEGILGGQIMNERLKEALAAREQLLDQFALLNSIENQRGKYLAALVELTRALPRDEVWFDSVKPLPGGGIVVEGRSYSDAGIEQFMNELRLSPRFFGMEVGTGSATGRGLRGIPFKVEIQSISKIPPQFEKVIKAIQGIGDLMKFQYMGELPTGKSGLRLQFYQTNVLGERIRDVIAEVERDPQVREGVKQYIVLTMDPIIKEPIDRYIIDQAVARDLYQGKLQWAEWSKENREDPAVPIQKQTAPPRGPGFPGMPRGAVRR
jgi:type IV pilus assembly protein PilM